MPNKKSSKRPRVSGRVPGVSVPATAKSAAASRVNAWKHGGRATVVSPQEVREHQEGRIATATDAVIKRSSLTIPEDLWHRAKVKALEKRMDLKDLIETALEEYLDRESEGELPRER